ncbi:cytokine receptor-like factor 2 isoform X3 [Equus przewalskii]|uniref:Cytokine receptor-like factor 2 isoform X3 n=1 Tax=Equus przewalskii TaxID=9798 RepID=A0ABM4N3P5_EQUPR
MRGPFLPWAAGAVLVLGSWMARGAATGPEGPLQVQIINFNFKTVQVTWNSSGSPGVNLTFSYSFRPNEGDSSCPEYILEDGHTVGCVLQAEGDGILSFSIRRGMRPLLAKSQWISSYLKPDPPGDLTFRWHEEAVTVTCSELPHKSLLYEIQYKSTFDPEWQAEEGRSCNVSIPGLDPDKCYFFRARARTMEAAYGPDTYPSDWSEVAHQQRGRRRDSCQEQRLFPRFVLISGAVAFLTVVLLLVSLWKLRRVKKLLMPSVPDPKFTFPGLFESHRGNFQEWIKDTQNVASLNKTDDGEQECFLEEALEVQPAKAEAETPTGTPTGEEEAAADPSQLPRRFPPGREAISLGDFTFVMTDNSYMML